MKKSVAQRSGGGRCLSQSCEDGTRKKVKYHLRKGGKSTARQHTCTSYRLRRRRLDGNTRPDDCDESPCHAAGSTPLSRSRRSTVFKPQRPPRLLSTCVQCCQFNGIRSNSAVPIWRNVYTCRVEQGLFLCGIWQNHLFCTVFFKFADKLPIFLLSFIIFEP